MRALITGITGQDGSYLAELLLAKGYEVHGMVRRASSESYERLEHIRDRLHLHQADLHDQLSLMTLLADVRPREVYNLAAQTFVPTSFSQPVLTAELTALGMLRLLEAVRAVDPEIRFFQASSSEIFGRACEEPQNEHTPCSPRSPYGAAKAYGHWITINYRERYDLFACSGIMFNHESPRRGKEFVSRKITDAVARIKHGLATRLTMGNVEAQRDWGFAGDYVVAMWLMLQQERADDFVVATGVKHSVRELLELAFGYAGLDWREHVDIDPALFRPVDVNTLCGDPTKARDKLGWKYGVGFAQLVTMMVEADLERVGHSLA